MTMLDIHTHLHFESFDADREDVIARAREVGVKQMIAVACHQSDFDSATRLAEQYEDMYASIGVHPNEFRKEVSGDWLGEMKEYIFHEKVIAVGECGLDFSLGHGEVDDAIKERQIQAFRAQLELAEEQKLPVIVHCRDAYRELLEVLQDFTDLKIVLHCYMGDTEVTHEFLKLANTFFSFTGNITYPVKKPSQNSSSIEAGRENSLYFDPTQVVKLIPKERLFVETDCPFLAPQARRGSRNEPAFVNETAQKVAELLEVPLEELERQLQENFRAVFR